MGINKTPTNQELSLNKLIILYMLDTISMPITNTKITEFVLENYYTNYFSLQEYLIQMEESNLIKTTMSSNKTLYTMTEAGKTTLEFFKNRIPENIKTLANNYLKDNKYEIRETKDIQAEYIPIKDDEYMVRCTAKENNRILLEIGLKVYDKEIAVQMCENFKDHNHEVYKSILTSLTEIKAE